MSAPASPPSSLHSPGAARAPRTEAQLGGGVIAGQLSAMGGNPEQFGSVLELRSPLAPCVSDAIDALRGGHLRGAAGRVADQGRSA